MTKLYFDGSCSSNPGPMGWAVIIVPDVDPPSMKSGGGVDGTSNQAEYQALLLALDNVPEGEIAVLYTDSKLVYSQINGIWETKDTVLDELRRRAIAKMLSLNGCLSLEWMPRNTKRLKQANDFAQKAAGVKNRH